MAEPDDFNPADLEAVLDILRTAPDPIPADLDPAKVRAPGVWLRLDGFTPDSLHGLTINTTLHPVVGEADRTRATTAVADLFNRVKAKLRAAGLEVYGQVTPARLILPGSSTPLPALAVPLDIPTCQTPEE